jgi:hypothetical protein
LGLLAHLFLAGLIAATRAKPTLDGLVPLSLNEIRHPHHQHHRLLALVEY